MSKSTHQKIPHRPTIGFIPDYIKGKVSYHMWHGVIGVLDVQEDKIAGLGEGDGLGQEDVDALQAIANQGAVALQNVK